MNVKTHSGFELLDESRINEVLKQETEGLDHVDWTEIAARCRVSWYDGITTDELAESTILAARSLFETHPNYEFAAARLLLRKIDKEVRGTFEGYLHSCGQERLDRRMNDWTIGDEEGLFDSGTLNKALKPERDKLFRYQGVKTLYDRYLLRDSNERLIEKPQWMWMRVAMGIALGEKENHTDWAIKFYNLISSFDYMPSTPTLFNAGTAHPQMASCYVTHVGDSLDDIFKTFAEIANMSKWAGGVGTNWSSVRGTGSRIMGTNGESTGLIPWLKIQNDIAVAVNQGGKRRGSHCAYVEPWHVDIIEFLDLRKPVGDDRRRTHDLDTALWIPDLFMERVRDDGDWSLFCPSEIPELTRTWGETFKAHYIITEGHGVARKTMKARDLWKKILSALYETGHPWITFKDRCNEANPLQSEGMIRSSNLCTEITLNTSENETAVCNLGSINLENYQNALWLEDTVKLAVRMLDNIIDTMFYPTEEAARTNKRNRPIGLGVMGWQNFLYKRPYQANFDSNAAFGNAEGLQYQIQKYAIESSEQLAIEKGVFDSYEASSFTRPRRNSYLLAIAPTATISTIVGTSPSIEPLFSNIFTISNLSGEFTTLNRFLVDDLQQLELWDSEMLNELKFHNGSIQKIERIPYYLKLKYKTAFEINPKVLIDLAAIRQPHICQSQSLNLYVDKVTGQELSDIYAYAWEKGLKTTYYLRTLGASHVEKSTVDPNKYGKTHMRVDAPACGLSPQDADGCESCQ